MSAQPPPPNSCPTGPNRRRPAVAAVWVAILCLSCGLLLPAVTEVRDGEAYALSAYNLRQIGGAILNYHEAYQNRLPPVALRDKGGRPLLSWRVLVLPYLEQDLLYQEFDLTEAWDGPHNKPLRAKMPQVYAKGHFGSTGPPYATHYQVVAGPGTAFERDGLSPADFPDGPGNTVLVIEAADPVPWTKPGDLVYDPNGPVPRVGLGYTRPVKFLGRQLYRKAGINAVFADGTWRFIDARIDDASLRALFTRNGGEPVDPSKLE